jgi:hydrogenase maturation protein HypF
MDVHRRIEVSGIVQGVGFRPFVVRLASSRQLRGNIRNTSSGVTIEVEGAIENVNEFTKRLRSEAPHLARITSLTVCNLPCDGAERDFRILDSEAGEPIRTLILPDVATCDDCLRELFDPSDRRFGYPFINCTNCGPRFTIVRDLDSSPAPATYRRTSRKSHWDGRRWHGLYQRFRAG